MKVLNNQDKELLKTAISRTYGSTIIGELGEFEFLRNVECNGKVNQGKMIQLITDYILWSHATPVITVSEWAYLPDHPLQEFINKNYELIKEVPEVITHYINSQNWHLSKYGMPDDLKDYIPTHIESGDNIE